MDVDGLARCGLAAHVSGELRRLDVPVDPARRRFARFGACTGGVIVCLAVGKSVIKQPTSIGTCSKIHTIVAVIEHVPMEVGTQ